MISTQGYIRKYKPEVLFIFGELCGKNNVSPTLKNFIKLTEKTAQSGNFGKDILAFKGDMLEILSNIFFETYGCDEKIGLIDYKHVSISDDYGVDATGINANGDTCAVQVKYRKNITEEITYSDIAKTFTSGVLKHNLNPIKDNNVWLFTTAKGVTIACDNVMGKKLRQINYAIISQKIDNNFSFWKNIENIINDAL